jgi:hypothetical protein
MPLISGSIPNLINGVSQQPPSLRLKTQAEVQENAVSSVVSGLLKRPGTEHLKLLTGSGNPLNGITNIDTAFIHSVRRDQDTLNTLVVTNVGGTANVYMFDRDGNPLTVTGNYAYLNSATNPKEDLAAVTVADYTYILNKKKNVAINSATTPLPSTSRRYEALVYVKQGDYQTKYTMKVRRPGGSWVTGTYTTGKSTNSSVADTQAAEASIKTDNIANQIDNGTMPSGINKARYNNVIHLYSSSDFEVAVEDSRGNTHLLAFKQEVNDFKSLPKEGPNNFLIKVAGDNEKAQDDYYVKLIADTTGQGVWKETVKPEIAYQFDADTMPQQIRRTGATSYVFENVAWAERKAGDDDSNPFPLFAEENLPLTDIFFHKNRMGLLYDENLILSESGEFNEYNFFRRTVLTLVDSDPIDVAVSNNQVSLLKHAVPFNESLILFSDQTQFKLNTLDVLAPDTVSVDVTTQFEASLRAKPVGAGRFVYFPVKRGKWSGVREYFVDSDTETNDANDITAHVPYYIEGEINRLAASSNEDTILCTTDEDPKTLYVYQYYWQNKEKLQSAWSKWTFDATILNFAFSKSDIFLLMKYDDGSIALEKINLSTDTATLDTLGAWSIHLDRRSQLTNGTSLTTPEVSISTDHVVITEDGELLKIVGETWDAAKITKATSLAAQGKKIWAGTPFNFRYVFSEQVMRQEKEPITIGRLQIRSINVVYSDTGFFEAIVIPRGADDVTKRNNYKTQFTGKTVGGITNILNQPAISDGTFRINTMSNAQGLHVELFSDSHLPCAFQSAEWEGFYKLRSNRI